MALKPIRLPSCGVHVYESKHRDGDVVEVHHHDIYQILYALDGEGRIAIGSRVHETARDQVVFLTPGTKHSVVSDTRLTLLVLAFGAAAVDAYLALAPAAVQQLSRSFAYKPGPLYEGEWRYLLRRLLHERGRSAQDALDGASVRVTLVNLLHLLAQSSLSPPMPDVNTLRAERIRKEIETNYFQPFSLEALAARMGISSRYVNEIFKERYGMTPVRYLTEVRMERAKKLLTETDHDIVSVCFEVGYDTLSTFYRTFKNRVGLSPNQYRQIARERKSAGGNDSPQIGR